MKWWQKWLNIVIIRVEEFGMHTIMMEKKGYAKATVLNERAGMKLKTINWCLSDVGKEI